METNTSELMDQNEETLHFSEILLRLGEVEPQYSQQVLLGLQYLGLELVVVWIREEGLLME
jgi:hypothetical protein